MGAGSGADPAWPVGVAIFVSRRTRRANQCERKRDMGYDLVIRNGSVVDGSGLPSVRADVGIKDGRIATVGRIRERGDQEIDAERHVVTPGFVDGHTHMDAQVFWDRLGTNSCWHG